MFIIAASGVVCGAVLGGRFKVFILVPAHLLAVGIAGAAAAMGHVTLTRAVLATIAWSVGCHVGYVVAAIVAAAAVSAAAEAGRSRAALHHRARS